MENIGNSFHLTQARNRHVSQQPVDEQLAIAPLLSATQSSRIANSAIDLRQAVPTQICLSKTLASPGQRLKYAFEQMVERYYLIDTTKPWLKEMQASIAEVFKRGENTDAGFDDPNGTMVYETFMILLQLTGSETHLLKHYPSDDHKRAIIQDPRIQQRIQSSQRQRIEEGSFIDHLYDTIPKAPTVQLQDYHATCAFNAVLRKGWDQYCIGDPACASTFRKVAKKAVVFKTLPDHISPKGLHVYTQLFISHLATLNAAVCLVDPYLDPYREPQPRLNERAQQALDCLVNAYQQCSELARDSKDWPDRLPEINACKLDIALKSQYIEQKFKLTQVKPLFELTQWCDQYDECLQQAMASKNQLMTSRVGMALAYLQAEVISRSSPSGPFHIPASSNFSRSWVQALAKSALALNIKYTNKNLKKGLTPYSASTMRILDKMICGDSHSDYQPKPLNTLACSLRIDRPPQRTYTASNAATCPPAADY